MACSFSGGRYLTSSLLMFTDLMPIMLSSYLTYSSQESIKHCILPHIPKLQVNQLLNWPHIMQLLQWSSVSTKDEYFPTQPCFSGCQFEFEARFIPNRLTEPCSTITEILANFQWELFLIMELRY